MPEADTPETEPEFVAATISPDVMIRPPIPPAASRADTEPEIRKCRIENV